MITHSLKQYPLHSPFPYYSLILANISITLIRIPWHIGVWGNDHIDVTVKNGIKFPKIWLGNLFLGFWPILVIECTSQYRIKTNLNKRGRYDTMNFKLHITWRNTVTRKNQHHYKNAPTSPTYYIIYIWIPSLIGIKGTRKTNVAPVAKLDITIKYELLPEKTL